MSEKRKVPWFWRRHFACPDCGLTISEYDVNVLAGEPSFDCARCKAHYIQEDFYKENENKWKFTMVEEDD